MSDRLALANAIEDAGIERNKAERVASVIVDIIRDSVATKADLQQTETTLKADLQHTETALKADLQQTETTLKADFKADVSLIRADLRLLKWQVGLLFALAGPTLLLLIRVAIKTAAIG